LTILSGGARITVAMLALVLAASAVCAVTLGTSAVAKLRAPGRASVALVRFGLARRARRSAGRALGGLEAALAIALIAFPASAVPLALAALLFAAFAVLIGRALGRGQRFDCGCFGESEALGAGTLVRALTLLAIALTGFALVVADAGLAAPSVGDRIVALVLGGLLVTLASLVSTLRRTRPFDPALREAA
jgi:hypothetical protein